MEFENAQFPILIAVTTALSAWGIAQIVLGFMQTEKRKIARRLAGDPGADDAAANHPGRSVVLQRRDADLPHGLGKYAYIRGLNKKLVQAYPEAKITKLLTIMGGMALMACLIVALIMDSIGAGLVAGVVAGYLPVLFLNGKRNKRQKRMVLQLPEALDFLTRVLRAGHSLSTGLQMMGDELPEPLAAEFRRAYSQHSLGQSLEDSLRDMTRHIDSGDFAFFVTAILIQRQTGGDLTEVLQNISGMIRQRIRLQSHVKAITAEGRLTSYVLVAFPGVLFAISYALNPEYAGVLIHTDTGRMFMGGALVLQCIGLFVIRKIVTVAV